MGSSPTPSINNTPVELDIAEFISRRMRDISVRINCHTIGTIVSFNATKQTAVVSVNFLNVVKGSLPLGSTGQALDAIQTLPPQLVDVPILFLQGGVSYITLPIAVGDSCLLLYCDRDMDIWLNTAQVTIPNSDRVHSLNDAVALVGLRDFTRSLPSYRTDVISVTDQTGERLNQAGFLQPYAGSSAPSGWLLCYGQAISRTTYAVLFAVIGTTYGSGDGSTTFNVPDLRGRTIAGLDNMGGSNANVLTNTYNPNRNTLGGAVGEEAHSLSVAELAIHDHNIQLVNADTSNGPNVSGDGQTSTTFNKKTDTTGSGTPHQTVQPSMMINWIIKL